jgi:hypothetical protein
MNAPTSKNVICLEIMDRPQVRSSKVELLLLVTVVCFDSYSQLFQLFNQRFQHHIEAWTTFQIGHDFGVAVGSCTSEILVRGWSGSSASGDMVT